MRFTKFGKALLMGALTAGVVYGITSCDQSYTVGYIYVTGTVTASSGSNGIITGIRIDHNTGQMNAINGLPIASGGANPVRAVLTQGSRFLYVLNRGVSASGSADCYGTGANQCLNSNITQFAVGGNGILTAQETFYTQASIRSGSSPTPRAAIFSFWTTTRRITSAHRARITAPSRWEPWERDMR